MVKEITEQSLKDLVKDETYLKVGVKTTVCCLTLKNGFEVIGTSACVNPDNYSVIIGHGLAYENAFNKLWELEGYFLQKSLTPDT
jgi:hypothetical protein